MALNALVDSFLPQSEKSGTERVKIFTVPQGRLFFPTFRMYSSCDQEKFAVTSKKGKTGGKSPSTGSGANPQAP